MPLAGTRMAMEDEEIVSKYRDSGMNLKQTLLADIIKGKY